MDNSRQNAQLSNPRNPKKIDGSMCGDWKIFWDEGPEGCPLAAPRTGVKMAKGGG